MSVMTYGLNIIFGKIDASVVTAYGLYYKVQQFVLFGLSGTTQDLCIGAMRIVSVSFIFAGINIALQGVFQALESGMESLIISLCRQLLFVLPIAFIFSLLARQSMDYMWLVWSTFIIAEGVSAAIAYFFLNKVKHKKIALLKN